MHRSCRKRTDMFTSPERHQKCRHGVDRWGRAPFQADPDQLRGDQQARDITDRLQLVAIFFRPNDRADEKTQDGPHHYTRVPSTRVREGVQHPGEGRHPDSVQVLNGPGVGRSKNGGKKYRTPSGIGARIRATVESEEYMAKQIKMPALAQTSDEMRLIRWLVEVGQEVKRGQELCEVESDKATMPLESYESGVLLKRCVGEDVVVTVGTVIAYIGEPGEMLAPEMDETQKVKSEAIAGRSAEERESSFRRPSGHINATPLVIRIAERNNMDLRMVRGTGPGGRITERIFLSLPLEKRKWFLGRRPTWKGESQRDWSRYPEKLSPRGKSLSRGTSYEASPRYRTTI